MLIRKKKGAKPIAVIMAVFMAVTVWGGLPAVSSSGNAYAADSITWGWDYADEDAGYLLFDWDGSAGQDEITSTEVKLPGTLTFKAGATVADMVDVSKLPNGLSLNTGASSFTSNTVTLQFDYVYGSNLFEGEPWDAKNPRRIGVLDIAIKKGAIDSYSGADIKVPIVAEAAKKWEIPYGARIYRELFTVNHGSRPNYFQGGKYDWTEDLTPSTYWNHPDFYEMDGKYGSLNILSNYRTQQQPTNYSCGIAATLSVLDYWGRSTKTTSTGREVTKKYNKSTSSFQNLPNPVKLNEQDLSKIRTLEGLTYKDRQGNIVDRFWGGPTYQDEMVNMIMNLHTIYGQDEWNFTSGFDLVPVPDNTPAHDQTPKLNVLGLSSGDPGYDAALDMPLSEAVPWYIKHGVPVVIGWNGWGGHYETIFGYDDMGTPDQSDDVIIIEEPYDSVDHLNDGYLIKPWQKFIDDWSVGGFGKALAEEDSRAVDRFVFLAAWPNDFDPTSFTHVNNSPLPPNTDNGSLTTATVIKGSDSTEYQNKISTQLSGLSGAEALPTALPHAGSAYWKTDQDKITRDGADVIKLDIEKYSDFETIQASARNLDGPASLLMALNYYEPTGMLTDIDLAKLKGTGKELEKTTLEDMIKIVDALNEEAITATGSPAWGYYSTLDMDDEAECFGEEVDEENIIPVVMDNEVPLLTLAHEGGDQWNVIIGMEDPMADDEDEATQEDVIVLADPVDISDHNPNGLSAFQYEWLVYDWANSIDSEDISFLAVWAMNDFSKAKVAKVKDQAYNGKAKKPAVKVTYEGKVLEKGVDYTVKYSNNKKVGKAKATITGINKYMGKKSVSFKINPKKTNIKKAKAGNKQVTITWKKVKGTTKYQVRYKLKSAKKWTVKTVSAKKDKLTIKNLKKGKQYQFQVGSFKKVKGVKYYSAWSKTKTVKIK